MSRQTLTAYATHINLFADHTFVYCPDKDKYFNCWGTHSGKRHRVVSGQGMYDVADCYRGPMDSAKIGVYGVTGVCHQSANCFLFSSGKTLSAKKVRGYWASVATYGVYGKLFSWWRPAVYTPCWLQHRGDMPEDSLSKKIQALHAAAVTGGATKDVDKCEMILKEAAITAQHIVPGIDPPAFQALHASYLKEVESLLSSGAQGKELADKVNDLSRKFQESLATKLPAREFEELMGVKPGEALGIVDPEIAAKAARNSR
jgi:hypothetical protein